MNKKISEVKPGRFYAIESEVSLSKKILVLVYQYFPEGTTIYYRNSPPIFHDYDLFEDADVPMFEVEILKEEFEIHKKIFQEVNEAFEKLDKLYEIYNN